ncbi:hypothetical protein N7504_010096 [Penicillium tannophilum]|nr:hypothetical protein N7504_010096 [Penicillium tannophilum]
MLTIVPYLDLAYFTKVVEDKELYENESLNTYGDSYMVMTSSPHGKTRSSTHIGSGSKIAS